MPLLSDPDPLVFQRVKGALKSVGMSQKDLAQHLGLAQGVVSLALNGGNEKTFRRIVDLLVKEHGIDPQQLFGKDERGDKILIELKVIKEELNALRQEIRDLGKKIEGGD
jgi:transcriptional regulator with XRE-family HTH domain